jgi:hypothetical protein
MRTHKHNLSHTRLATAEMGKLIPLTVVEALPGDTFQHHSNVLIRVSPLAAPVFHNVTARVHHFFVPNRLVWDGWENFITGGPDGNNADTVPQISNNGSPNTLLDYMGVRPAAGCSVNALPIRAFNLIYNEFYRDQDLVAERTSEDVSVPNVAWEKDYFTTCRPWTQKGDDVTIPLGDRAYVKGFAMDASWPWATEGQSGVAYDSSAEAPADAIVYPAPYADIALDAPDAQQNVFIKGQPLIGGNYRPDLYADLANATGANINDVRKAFALQRYQEARARYGSRYTEYLRYLGVTPRDSRLQRPEFLGGGQTQLNFSEIMQTGPDATQAPGDERFGVADLYGHGIAAMKSNRYRRFIDEHGFIISLLSVRPKAIYQDGVHRQWLRLDKEDYYQRELQWIGQQPVWNAEVFCAEDPVFAKAKADGVEILPEPTDNPINRETFGYQDRYAEYREHPSGVSAEFRDLLNYWHMARDFEDTPTLNQSFTDCVPTKRIYNEQTTHPLWIMCQHRMVARRLVPRSAMARIL